MPKACLEIQGCICKVCTFLRTKAFWVKLFPVCTTVSHLPASRGVLQGAPRFPGTRSTTRTRLRACTGFPESYLRLCFVSYSLRLLWFLTLYFDLQPLCSAAGFPGGPCARPSGLGHELHIRTSFFKQDFLKLLKHILFSMFPKNSVLRSRQEQRNSDFTFFYEKSLLL